MMNLRKEYIGRKKEINEAAEIGIYTPEEAKKEHKKLDHEFSKISKGYYPQGEANDKN
jgi:hypothetical protein